MASILLVIHVLVVIALIAMVLLQQGKGADAGAAFGSGASATVFGSRGSGSFMTRATATLAALFFVTSLTLAYLSGQKTEGGSVVDQLEPQNLSVPVLQEHTESDVPALLAPDESAQ